MSVWFGWPENKNNETYNIKASEVNMTMNLDPRNIFNGSITTTFKQSNFLDAPISTFRDTATFTINPYDKKHAPDDILPGIRPGSFGEEVECTVFEKELIEKLNDKEFQAAARQRYKILLSGISKNSDDKIMSKEESAKYFRSLPELTGQEDDSILQYDSVSPSELPTQRAGKTIKELTQEVQYDLEREHDVKKREELIMQCARYIRLERMSESLNDLT